MRFIHSRLLYKYMTVLIMGVGSLLRMSLLKFGFFFVALTGVEPVTQGFSVLCSTY